MKDDIESSSDSKDLREFARLFQHAGQEQVLVPTDLDSFLEVIERFISCMFQSLPTLPAIRFEENSLVCFSPITQLSSEGRKLSERIRQILKHIHSLKEFCQEFCRCEDLISSLNEKNLEDNDQWRPYRVVYRGFEILLRMIQMIQESNGAIYTLINEHIMIQTSTRPEERRQLYAMMDLSNIIRTFLIENDEGDFDFFACVTCRNRSYLHLADEGKIIPFLLECLLYPDFLQTLENLLLCGDDHDLEEFAKSFMNNPKLVGLFREYIQENKKTWCRA